MTLMEKISNTAFIPEGTRKYPLVEIRHPYPEYLPIIAQSLNKSAISWNEVQILVKHPKEDSMIAIPVRIQLTPLELSKITRMYSIAIKYSETDEVLINRGENLLERRDIRWTV